MASKETHPSNRFSRLLFPTVDIVVVGRGEKGRQGKKSLIVSTVTTRLFLYGREHWRWRTG